MSRNYTRFRRDFIAGRKRHVSLHDQMTIPKAQEIESRQNTLKSKLFKEVPSRWQQAPVVAGKENDSSTPPEFDKHAEFGKVPSYLIKMEADKKSQLADLAEKERQSRIPPGCRYMTEEERLQSIQEVQESRREVLDSIKRLPLSIETLGQRKRKIELDMKMCEIDRTLEKLSYKSVLIRN